MGLWSVREGGYLLVTQGQDFFTRRIFPGFHDLGIKQRFTVAFRTSKSLSKKVSTPPFFSLYICVRFR